MRRLPIAGWALVLGYACSISAHAAAQEPLPVYPAESVADAPGFADSERPRFDDRPLVLGLRTGAGSATGLAGGVLEYNVHDRLALNVGLGTNLLGISTAVGARVRPVIGATRNRKQLHAFVVEASLSRSAYLGEWMTNVFCEEDCVQPRYVGWAQAELGWEARIGHFQVQTTLGAAFMLGNPQFSCRRDGFDSPANCSPTEPVPRTLFTQTVGLGYAF